MSWGQAVDRAKWRTVVSEVIKNECIQCKLVVNIHPANGTGQLLRK